MCLTDTYIDQNTLEFFVSLIFFKDYAGVKNSAIFLNIEYLIDIQLQDLLRTSKFKGIPKKTTLLLFLPRTAQVFRQ